MHFFAIIKIQMSMLLYIQYCISVCLLYYLFCYLLILQRLLRLLTYLVVLKLTVVIKKRLKKK